MAESKKVVSLHKGILASVKKNNKPGAEMLLHDLLCVMLREKVDPFPMWYYDLKTKVERMN